MSGLHWSCFYKYAHISKVLRKTKGSHEHLAAGSLPGLLVSYVYRRNVCRQLGESQYLVNVTLINVGTSNANRTPTAAAASTVWQPGGVVLQSITGVQFEPWSLNRACDVCCFSCSCCFVGEGHSTANGMCCCCACQRMPSRRLFEFGEPCTCHMSRRLLPANRLTTNVNNQQQQEQP